MIDIVREEARIPRGIPGTHRKVTLVYGRIPLEKDTAKELSKMLVERGFKVKLVKKPWTRARPASRQISGRRPNRMVDPLIRRFGFKNPDSHVFVINSTRGPGDTRVFVWDSHEHAIYDQGGEFLPAGHHLLDLGSSELIPVAYEPSLRAFMPTLLARHSLNIDAPREKLTPGMRQEIYRDAFRKISDVIADSKRVGLNLFGSKKHDATPIEAVLLKSRRMRGKPKMVIRADGSVEYPRGKIDVEGYRQAVKYALKLAESRKR